MDAPISGMPPELLFKVFESLGQDNYISNSTHNSLQHPFRAFTNCRLVSRRWKNLVDPLAFRRFRYIIDGEDISHSIQTGLDTGSLVSHAPTNDSRVLSLNPFYRECAFLKVLSQGEYCSLVRTLDIDLKLCSEATSIAPLYWELADEFRARIQPQIDEMTRVLDASQHLSVRVLSEVVLSCRQLTAFNLSFTLQRDNFRMPVMPTVSEMLAHVVDQCPMPLFVSNSASQRILRAEQPFMLTRCT
jgi:hypothetical protein